MLFMHEDYYIEQFSFQSFPLMKELFSSGEVAHVIPRATVLAPLF